MPKSKAQSYFFNCTSLARRLGSQAMVDRQHEQSAGVLSGPGQPLGDQNHEGSAVTPAGNGERHASGRRLAEIAKQPIEVIGPEGQIVRSHGFAVMGLMRPGTRCLLARWQSLCKHRHGKAERGPTGEAILAAGVRSLQTGEAVAARRPGNDWRAPLTAAPGGVLGCGLRT